MWVEIVKGAVGQEIDDNAPVITAAGTQYPWNFPKSQIPNLVNVVLAAKPDPTQFIVTGYTINFASGTATQVLTTEAIPLSEIQTTRIANLAASCAAAIVGRYQSSALGAAHTYPSSTNDQINMLGSVSASVLPNLPAGWTTVFWCADSTGAWAMRPHTATQIQQAGSDGKAWVTTCQVKLDTLGAEVLAATTPAAVQAVVWT